MVSVSKLSMCLRVSYSTYMDLHKHIYVQYHILVYMYVYVIINIEREAEIDREEMAYSNIDVLESKTIKEPYHSTDCEG